MECPRCGHVLRFSSQTRSYRVLNPVRKRPPRERKAARLCKWNPHTSRLRCGECDLILIIGLVAWPVQPGGAVTLPRDQVPNERQLGQLRAEAGGWWMPERLRTKPYRASHTNITAACTCRAGTENTGAGDPGCLIHGAGGGYVPPKFEGEDS